jgi:hypothetical protein
MHERRETNKAVLPYYLLPRKARKVRLQTQRNALTPGLITRWRIKVTCDLRGSIKLHALSFRH